MKVIEGIESEAIKSIYSNREDIANSNKLILKNIPDEFNSGDIKVLILDHEGGNNYILNEELNLSTKAKNNMGSRFTSSLVEDRIKGSNNINFSSFIFTKLPKDIIKNTLDDARKVWRSFADLYNEIEEEEGMHIKVEIDTKSKKWEKAYSGPKPKRVKSRSRNEKIEDDTMDIIDSLIKNNPVVSGDIDPWEGYQSKRRSEEDF